MPTDNNRFAVCKGNLENFPKIPDFGLLLQLSDLGTSLFEKASKINKLDLCAVGNKRIFILNLLRRGFARGNTLPVPRPFFAVKAINFGKSHPFHTPKISKYGLSVKQSEPLTSILAIINNTGYRRMMEHTIVLWFKGFLLVVSPPVTQLGIDKN